MAAAVLRASGLELVRVLGLGYGAIDLRLIPDGDYVSEVNPAGQFLFLEV